MTFFGFPVTDCLSHAWSGCMSLALTILALTTCLLAASRRSRRVEAARLARVAALTLPAYPVRRN